MSDVSPAELLLSYLESTDIETLAPGGVVVGPANDEQQQQGVVQIVQSGMPKLSHYVRVTWARCQIRIIAPNLALSDQIAQHLAGLCDRKSRLRVVMPSTGEEYLVHLMNVSAGPSQHYDSRETWENLLFVEFMVGLDPLA